MTPETSGSGGPVGVFAGSGDSVGVADGVGVAFGVAVGVVDPEGAEGAGGAGELAGLQPAAQPSRAVAEPARTVRRVTMS